MSSIEDIKLGSANRTWYCNIYFWRKWGYKTQQAVIDAYEAWREGKTIISNVWLSFPHIRFTNSKSLVPILKEINDYCSEEKMAVDAPSKMLNEYWIKRKKKKLKEFFILFDEIGKHLNRRNWNTNFKDAYLRDMLTEPRKCNMTIVGITQSWKRVDIEFLEACEDWFHFSKTGLKVFNWYLFEKMHITHFWVLNGELDLNKPMILNKTERRISKWKELTEYRDMYWTGELIWDGLYKWTLPHSFKKGDIFTSSFKDTVPESSSEASPEGVEPTGEE